MKLHKSHPLYSNRIFFLFWRLKKGQLLRLSLLFLLGLPAYLSATPDTSIIVPKPTITSNSPVCENGTLKLATPFQNSIIFHWYDPQGNEISVVANATIPNIELSMAGSYSLKAEEKGCFSEAAFIDIEVISKPVAPVVSSNGPLCEGETLFLDGPSLPNTAYKWIDPFGTVISNEEDVTISNIPKELTGDYFLEITQLGCASHLGWTDVGVIAINEIPDLSIDAAVCEGDTLMIKGPHIAGASYRWKGPNGFESENIDSLLFPIANTNLNGEFTLVLEASGCESPMGRVTVEVNAKPTATLSSGGILCEGETFDLGIQLTGKAPFELEYTINSIVQEKITTPKANFSLLVAPIQKETYSIISMADQTGCSPEIFGEATIATFSKPKIYLITDTLCDNINENYRIQINIQNGTKPYDYQGFEGDLLDSVFTSELLATNMPYEFQVIDENKCQSDKIVGQYNCPCSTEAGSVDARPISICGSERAEILHLNNENLDANDQLIFVLHDSPTSELGTIIASSDEPNFSYTDDLNINETYYISPIAANRQQNLVDLSDRCLSVGQGTALTFRPIPAQPMISGAQIICPGTALSLTTDGIDGQVVYQWETPFEIIETTSPNLMIEDISADYSGDFRVKVEKDGCASLLSENYPIDITIPSGQADAGVDTISCGNPTIFLNAKAPEFGYGKWTNDSGAYVFDPYDPKSIVSSLQEGLNIFYWTLSTDDCPNYEMDSIVIAYRPNALAVNDNFVLDETETFLDLNVLGNDISPGGHDIWVELFTEPHSGKVEYKGNGDFSYKRQFNGFNGETNFSYLLCFDTPSCPALCDTGAVIIDVMLDPLDPSLFVPDGITPNNDGINDRLVIEGIENHAENELILFDRWGNLLFQASPYKNSWDGTYNNEPLPEGAYYYVLKTDIVNKKTLKGRVYIIR